MVTFDVGDRRHLADVEVHPDEQRFAGLHSVEAAIELAVVGSVDRARRQVDELALEVRHDQLRRIRLHQGGDVVIRQVQLVVERAGLHKAVHLLERWLVAQLLHELQEDELEAFRRRGDIHPVLQPGQVVAHPSDDLAPGLLCLDGSQHVQLIHQGVANLETDNRLRLFHRPADHSAAVLPAAVNVDLVVCLVDLGLEPPVVGHLIHGWIEDVPDLRVSRCEVASVDAGPLHEVLAQCRAAYPGLT